MDMHLVTTTKMFAIRVNCNSVANCSLESLSIHPHMDMQKNTFQTIIRISMV